MRTLALQPRHPRIAGYHASLADFARLGVKHESAVRAAFQALLEDCTSLVNKSRADKWKLVPEYSLQTKAGAKITPDGALLDSFRLLHGLWEAKDTADDLDKEITRKFKLGYPRDNILFQSPTRAVLVQDGERALDLDIRKSEHLVTVLQGFFEYQAPAFGEREKAVAEFKDRLPEIGREMTRIVRAEYKTNKVFAEAFDGFVALCRQPGRARQRTAGRLPAHEPGRWWELPMGGANGAATGRRVSRPEPDGAGGARGGGRGRARSAARKRRGLDREDVCRGAAVLRRGGLPAPTDRRAVAAVPQSPTGG